MMNQYLILEPYIFINVIDDCVLFYNSANGKKKIFTSPAIIEFLNRNNNNLYVFLLLPNDLINKEIIGFVSDIRSSAMGFVHTSQVAPLQFSPVLKLQDVHKSFDFNEEKEIVASQNNIDSIFLFINHSNSFDSAITQYLYRNTSEGAKNEQRYEEINFDLLKVFLSSLITSNRLRSFDFLGNNLFKYSHIDSLMCFLENMCTEIPISIYLDANYSNQDLKQIEKILHIKLGKIKYCISNRCQKNNLIKLFDLGFANKMEIICLIEQEDDIDSFNTWLTQYETPCTFIPIYNGKNLSFFQTNVFIEQKDIDSIFLNQNQIYRNQTLNTNYYGKITVFPNGDVCSNVHTQPLGNISKDSLAQLIDNEVNSISNNWFCVKKNLAPCNECVYNIICPPISNYEFILKRNNLCSIKN